MFLHTKRRNLIYQYAMQLSFPNNKLTIQSKADQQRMSVLSYARVSHVTLTQ